MSMSPSNILSKLEELRKWQEKQQERLLEQHNKRLEQNNFTDSERDFLQNSLGVNVSLEKSQVSTASPPKISKRPMQKNLTQDCNDITKKNVIRAKQPFLKRGEGLSRFRMHPGEQFKPFTKSDKRSRSASSIKPTAISKPKLSQVSETNNSVITPLKAPDLYVKPRATWIPQVPIENRTPMEVTPKKLHNLNASDRELLIFETLEQRAVHNSFCSTNSSIVRLLSSTPHKNSPSKNNYNKKDEGDTNNIFEQCGVQQIYDSGDQFQDMYAHQQKPVSYGQYGKPKPTVSIKEIVDENEKIIEANAQQLEGIGNYEKKLQNELLDLIEKAIKFKEFIASDDVSSYTSASSITSEDLEQESTLQPRSNFNDEKEWSDAETTESKSSSLNTSDPQEQKRDMQTMTDNFVEDVDERESLKDRFRELEQELKTIQKENGKICKLKNQLDQQRREFDKHKKQIVKQVEDERVRIGLTLEEERKKLAKQKMIFEKHVKESLNKPSKKEREEIAALKSEVSALRETLKMKETKNGMALARLRNQIKRLENDNTSLKTEVEKLNIQNGKLLATHKLTRKPTDTKILHEINKNITKLTQEQSSRRSVEIIEKEESSDEEEIKLPKKSRSNLSSSGTTSKTSLHRRPRHLSESDEKENDQNISNNKAKSTSNLSNIEEAYDRTFKSNYELVPLALSNSNHEETNKSDRTEIILSDGTKHIEYTNGNIKTISPDGNLIIFKYYNGDIKETKLLAGTVRYRYHASQVIHTTNVDGTELIEFPNGQTERRLKDSCEVEYPNGIIRRTQSTGTEEICYPDGTAVTMNMQGDRILQLPNGQKEIHTKEHKRREYPDGTIKILYPDGLQETRYANGRVRLKDKHGKLLMDSHNPDMLDV